jgi:hypothetical protein
VRRLGRPVAPKCCDQVVAGYNLTLVEQEKGEERAVLLARRRQIDPIGVYFEPAEQPKLHLVSIVAPSWVLA